MWVGLRQSIEVLSGTERLTLLQVRVISPCPTAFKLGRWLFPTLGLKQKQWLFLYLKSAGLELERYALGSPGPQAFRQALQHRLFQGSPC